MNQNTNTNNSHSSHNHPSLHPFYKEDNTRVATSGGQPPATASPEVLSPISPNAVVNPHQPLKQQEMRPASESPRVPSPATSNSHQYHHQQQQPPRPSPRPAAHHLITQIPQHRFDTINGNLGEMATIMHLSRDEARHRSDAINSLQACLRAVPDVTVEPRELTARVPGDMRLGVVGSFGGAHATKGSSVDLTLISSMFVPFEEAKHRRRLHSRLVRHAEAPGNIDVAKRLFESNRKTALTPEGNDLLEKALAIDRNHMVLWLKSFEDVVAKDRRFTIDTTAADGSSATPSTWPRPSPPNDPLEVASSRWLLPKHPRQHFVSAAG